jgi:hypothetical protein
MLFIVHSGQTGVERGAHDAARAAGLMIAGFMASDARDELGVLPAHVRERLTCCPERGQRPPIKANIEIASAALVVMPDAATAEQFPAFLWILQRIRARRLPMFLADTTSSVSEVATWAVGLPLDSGSVRLLVTGPRATRWSLGERLARDLVARIAISRDDIVPTTVRDVLATGGSTCSTH